MKIPLFSHMGTKIMAVVLAVFLWGFAYLLNLQDENITYVFRFSVEGDYTVDRATRSVVIKVRGPRRTVERLQREILIDKRITEEDLARFGEQDEILFPLEIVAEDLNGQRGVTYPDLPAERIDLKISRIDTKWLPVVVRTTGQAAPGYVPSPEDPQPRQVRATGPKSLLEKMANIDTEEVNIDALFSPYIDYVRLALPADFDSIRLEPDEVRVQIQFRQESSRKTFENIPIEVKALPEYPYRVIFGTPTASVTVEGPSEVVASLRPESISVFAEIDSSMVPSPTPYPEDLRVLIRDNPQLKSTLSPESITVTVEER